MTADEETWDIPEEQQSLNLSALAGMVAATLVAMSALFIVPSLEGQVFTPFQGFLVLASIEGGSALVVAFFLGRMHQEREYD